MKYGQLIKLKLGAIGLALLVLTAVANNTHAADIDRPTGIYSLDRIVDRPFVDGVAVRLGWATAEPVEGQYDFSRIERMVRDAQAVGQSITLANMMHRAPAWLVSKAETFRNGRSDRIVPWNPIAMAAMRRYAEAQANYKIDGIAIKDHPAIKQITAPINGINSLRLMQLPPGYNSEAFQQAVLDSVQIWADAYPRNKHLYVGLFGVTGGRTGQQTAADIRDALLERFDGISEPRINFFQELLTGFAPSVGSPLYRIMTDVSDRTGLMFQACGEWTQQDGTWARCRWIEPADTPDAGFNHGLNNIGATYFEIYPNDLLNDAYASQFQTWSNRLSNLP